jgi:thioredoxin reductase
MYDVIIVGGGPAGLTATIYCARKRLEALLITKDLGGKTNFRLQLPFVQHHQIITGEEVVNRFVSQIEYLDFLYTFDVAEDIHAEKDAFSVKTRQGSTYQTRALIIATGARAQMLNVPGEREFMMRGLCYSAVSYAPVFLDRKVAVVGDRNLAMRSAAELAQHAEHVFVVAPTVGQLESPLGRQLQQAANVTVLAGRRVQEVRGDRYARSLVVIRDDGAVEELTVDGIFVEQDLIPNSKMVANLVNLDEKGRIRVDAQNRTSRPGVFAAGDVTDTYGEQVLVAIGEGAKAALSAYDYLLETGLLQRSDKATRMAAAL